jgi:isopenicillin N synthase-like dioxygenase
MRVINYPAPEGEVEPGQLRAGAHTDYGCMTILRTEDAPGGLQVQTRAGEWLDVLAVSGSFVVNLGDMMARWTNDRWAATLHRVTVPPRDLASVGLLNPQKGRSTDKLREQVLFLQADSRGSSESRSICPTR